MKISLKLGDVAVETAASYLDGELLTFSAGGSSSRKIAMLTDEVAEIARDTLFIAGVDNSLAEMMAAARKGACAVLCTKAPDSLEKIPDLPLIVCKDVQTALQTFAKIYTAVSSHKTVLVTGSRGKTRTGEMIGAVLEECFAVHKAVDVHTESGKEAELLLDLPEQTDFHIAEVKLNAPADAERFGALFDFDLMVQTDDGGKLETAVVRDLLSAAGNNKKIVCDYADRELLLQFSPITVSVSDPHAALHAENVREDAEKTVFDLVYEGGCIKDVRIWFTGSEALKNALMAAAVGLHFGVPAERIRTGLNNDHDCASEVEIRTVGGVTMIVGSTSATEESMRRGIDTLSAIAKRNGNARKIALLGDIRDFGQNTSGLHMKMGAYAVERKVDLLFTFGVAAEQIGEGAKRAGMDKSAVSGNMELFSPQKSAEAVRKVLLPGDVLLIRIARRSAAAEIVRILKETLI